jgi:tRNA threonylcarbamoyladenosine biosynthesis protein TsaB
MALTLGAFEGHVCCCMDARRNQVYNAIFLAENGKMTRICEDRAIALAELKQGLEYIDGPIYLVGDGAALVKKTLSEEIPGLILPPEHRRHQRASGVGLAALRQMAAGEPADANSLTPNYLRLSQAERERLERQAK